MPYIHTEKPEMLIWTLLIAVFDTQKEKHLEKYMCMRIWYKQMVTKGKNKENRLPNKEDTKSNIFIMRNNKYHVIRMCICVYAYSHDNAWKKEYMYPYVKRQIKRSKDRKKNVRYSITFSRGW